MLDKGGERKLIYVITKTINDMNKEQRIDILKNVKRRYNHIYVIMIHILDIDDIAIDDIAIADMNMLYDMMIDKGYDMNINYTYYNRNYRVDKLFNKV